SRSFLGEARPRRRSSNPTSPPDATTISGNRKKFTSGEIPANSGNFRNRAQIPQVSTGLWKGRGGRRRRHPRRAARRADSAPQTVAVVSVRGEMSTVHAQIE